MKILFIEIIILSIFISSPVSAFSINFLNNRELFKVKILKATPNYNSQKNSNKIAKKIFNGAFDSVQSFKNTLYDASDIISNIPQESKRFPSFLNASTLTRTTQKVNNNAITLEKVGNVTLVAKQTINSISPANIISIPLQKLKRIINLYYDLEDTFDDSQPEKKTSLKESNVFSEDKRYAYRKRENKFSTIKESFFETIDIYTTSFENTKQFIQSVLKTVNDLQQTPNQVQSYFKSIENGFVGIQSNLIAIKNKFRDFLEWRPIDDIKNNVENTKNSIKKSISSIQNTINFIQNFGKKVKNIFTAITDPSTRSEKITLQPANKSKKDMKPKSNFFISSSENIRSLFQGASELKARIDKGQADLLEREAKFKQRKRELRSSSGEGSVSSPNSNSINFDTKSTKSDVDFEFAAEVSYDRSVEEDISNREINNETIFKKKYYGLNASKRLKE